MTVYTNALNQALGGVQTAAKYDTNVADWISNVGNYVQTSAGVWVPLALDANGYLKASVKDALPVGANIIGKTVPVDADGDEKFTSTNPATVQVSGRKLTITYLVNASEKRDTSTGLLDFGDLSAYKKIKIYYKSSLNVNPTGFVFYFGNDQSAYQLVSGTWTNTFGGVEGIAGNGCIQDLTGAFPYLNDIIYAGATNARIFWDTAPTSGSYSLWIVGEVN